MRTYDFREQVNSLGYVVTDDHYYTNIEYFNNGENLILVQISTIVPNNMVISDENDLLTEEVMNLCFLYSKTPIEDREAEYYHLKTDYDITGRSDYVYNNPAYQREYQRLILTSDRQEAETFNRKEAIMLANEYPYLELEEQQ